MIGISQRPRAISSYISLIFVFVLRGTYALYYPTCRRNKPADLKRMQQVTQVYKR